MDTASSKLEAAINSVLIPFSSPYPKRFSRNRLGTNTAGLTADKVNLQIDIGTNILSENSINKINTFWRI